MTSNSRITARADRFLLFSVPGRWRAAAVLGLMLAAGPAPGGAREWPRPLGYLSDFAGVVDAASRDSIDAVCRDLAAKTGAEIAVVTLRDLGGETIDPAATDLFQAWGIGKRGSDNGVLVLLALSERRVRIETGYGVEGILPDGFCGEIIRRRMGPELAQGRVGPGLLRGARAVALAIARDRGVTLEGDWSDPVSEGAESHGPGGVALVIVAFILLLVLILYLKLASGWVTAGNWRRREGPGTWNGWGGLGGPGGFGGLGGRTGRGGFGWFGGGRSGGGGASGGF